MRAPCFSFVRNLRQLTYPKLSIFECGAEQRFDLHNNFWLDVLTARVYASRTRVLFTTNLSWGLLGLVRLIKICKKLNTWSLSIQAKLSKIWKQRQIVQKSLQKFRKLLNFRNVNHSIENSKKIPEQSWMERTLPVKKIENLGIPRVVVLFFGNFGNRCSIRYRKLPKTQTGRFGWMEIKRPRSLDSELFVGQKKLLYLVVKEKLTTSSLGPRDLKRIDRAEWHEA